MSIGTEKLYGEPEKYDASIDGRLDNALPVTQLSNRLPEPKAALIALKRHLF